MIKIGTLLLFAAMFLTACEDPAANKVKAVTSNANTTNAAPANNTAAVPAKGESLAITPENSKVLFTGSKVTGSHDGGFTKFTGTINLANSKAEESSVLVDIETASVFTNEEKLTGHLKTADFFDVEKFPKASFASTRIEPDAAKGADNYTVTGDFELHGVKKSITFPATIKVATDDVNVNAEFSINRKDFGLVYAGKADDLIRDGVVIKLDLKTPRKK
jgi:polyisoprenoid-binding protein YceI